MAYNSAHTGPEIDAAVQLLGEIQSAKDATAADRQAVSGMAATVASQASQVGSQAASVSSNTAVVLASASAVEADRAEVEQNTDLALSAKTSAEEAEAVAVSAKEAVEAIQLSVSQSQVAINLSEQNAGDSASSARTDREIVETLAQQAEQDSASAAASAASAAAVVTGGTATLLPEPGKIPLAKGDGKIDPEWLPTEIARSSAVEAVSEKADTATSAAEAAEARTAGFLAPSAEPPVLRDNGLPLQQGDRYFNTIDQAEYIYKADGWAANDSVESIDAITDGTDPSRGAALIPYDETDLGAQTLLSRKLSNYVALRAYSGLATRVEITQSGIAGVFVRVGVVSGYADNGATVIVGAGGVVWVRQFTGALALDWFQPNKSGEVDAQPAVDAWLKTLGANGGYGFVSDGKYSLSTGVITPLNASFSVECSPGAEFIAAPGFPGAGVKVVAISTGVTPNQSFSWRGGRFDSHNQPYDEAYANDTFSINATNCSMCHVELDRVYSGPDWLNSGSDSHLFIGGPSSIFARIYDSIGARDTGIYISRNFAGTSGQFADVDGNFSKCNVAVIVKRRFESGRFHATAVDCITGVATGTADITDYASANAGHGFEVGVNAKRVEHPLFLNAASCVKGFVNAEQMGVSIAGYSSTASSAARFRGSKGCQIDVNARGVNPALNVNSDFVAAFFGPITTALDGTLNATENMVNINCSGLGIPFAESGAGTDNNTVVGKIDSMLSVFPTIVGPATKYELQRANIKYHNGARRMVNPAGVTLFSVNDDGSVSQGPQNTGVAGPAFTDFFNGQATRAARHIISGGTGVADSGTYQLNAADVVFNAPSTRAAGAFRPGQFTLTTLPSASAYNGYEIDVTNATGGPKRCRSNGSVWQILNTTTTVS